MLLTTIKVLNGGRLSLETKNWQQYWEPLSALGCIELDEKLSGLYSAWQSYLRSSFNPKETREYCFKYFSLLDALLSEQKESNPSSSWAKALQISLSFECFGISSLESGPVEVLGRPRMRTGSYSQRPPWDEMLRTYLGPEKPWPKSFGNG
uniref:Uncharacterized protein n=1 Tax=uncultured marine microorganism HF4000_010I05 TaxID=455517 RepID=B3T1J9_9ZZZZ|nr:hypothetical protein ALOHA_HF4000010I05ctg1g22 [uncultured marine microorganism HF4000_010I05]